MHPAYLVIVNAERCWAKDERQAQERAKVIVAKLVAAGILTDGEMKGDLFVRVNAVAGEQNQRGL